jgi:hypothetical protein
VGKVRGGEGVVCFRDGRAVSASVVGVRRRAGKRKDRRFACGMRWIGGERYCGYTCEPEGRAWRMRNYSVSLYSLPSSSSQRRFIAITTPDVVSTSTSRSFVTTRHRKTKRKNKTKRENTRCDATRCNAIHLLVPHGSIVEPVVTRTTCAPLHAHANGNDRVANAFISISISMFLRRLE